MFTRIYLEYVLNYACFTRKFGSIEGLLLKVYFSSMFRMLAPFFDKLEFLSCAYTLFLYLLCIVYMKLTWLKNRQLSLVFFLDLTLVSYGAPKVGFMICSLSNFTQLVYVCSSIQVFMTAIKYIPQVSIEYWLSFHCSCCCHKNHIQWVLLNRDRVNVTAELTCIMYTECLC